MTEKSLRIRMLILGLAIAMVSVTAPFSLAGTINATPLGSLTTAGTAAIGNVSAPTGTTIFSGDSVASSTTSAVQFNSGSRLEMTNADVTFTRDEGILTISADKGLLNFHFTEGERVQIEAGTFIFTGNGDTAVAGILGVNREGQLVMNVEEGVLMALNTKTGEHMAVSSETGVEAIGQEPPTIVRSGMSGIMSAALIAGVAASTSIVGLGLYHAEKSPNSR
jgi:hypothetical protein